MSELYLDYLKERCNRGSVSTEDGFATFDYVNQDVVYIVDLYVKPEKRRSHVAASLADKICEQAIKDGRKFLLGSIDVTAKGAEESTKVLVAYGMTPHKVVEPLIFYSKPLVVEAQNV